MQRAILPPQGRGSADRIYALREEVPRCLLTQLHLHTAQTPPAAPSDANGMSSHFSHTCGSRHQQGAAAFSLLWRLQVPCTVSFKSLTTDNGHAPNTGISLNARAFNEPFWHYKTWKTSPASGACTTQFAVSTNVLAEHIAKSMTTSLCLAHTTGQWRLPGTVSTVLLYIRSTFFNVKVQAGLSRPC